MLPKNVFAVLRTRKQGVSTVENQVLVSEVSAMARQYERIFEPHRAALQRYAYRLTQNVTEAEDLVQETLLRAYTKVHQINSARGSVTGWLYTILLNLFRNRLTAADALSRPHLSLDESFAESRVSTAPDPEMATLQAEWYSDTMGALEGLPQDYRQAVVLCDVEGKNYQEIADTMNIPIGTVRSRIYRGRQILRRRLFVWNEVV
jgi:RNA polymerase sigma factor (sigma-70 family)